MHCWKQYIKGAGLTHTENIFGIYMHDIVFLSYSKFCFSLSTAHNTPKSVRTVNVVGTFEYSQCSQVAYIPADQHFLCAPVPIANLEHPLC